MMRFEIFLFVAIGVVLGVLQIVSLRANVELYAKRGSRGAALAVHVARLGLTVAAWIAVARSGGAAGLVAALCGFLSAKLVTIHRLRGPT